jgi:phenylacetic acid degradation operon negative regulatory protein
VASTLLGVHPPRLPTGLLVRSCGLFGINDGTARVAISRMLTAGELVADEGGYALSGDLRTRQERQDLSRRAATRRWEHADGWRTAIVTAGGRGPTERTALRRAASTLRLAELREGVWLRPDNLATGVLRDAERVVEAQCLLARSDLDADGADLAASLWDLGGWAGRAARLRAALEASRPDLDRADRTVLPTAFVLSAAVLRHLQADPLLPAALLPAAWPGPDLRTTYEGWDAAFGRVWADWYRAERDR